MFGALWISLILFIPFVLVVSRLSGEEPLTPEAAEFALEGSWSGVIEGTLGPSVALRQYRFVLGNRFLQMMHDRDPGAFAAEDDDYEEWAFFSFDADRGVYSLREFLVDGLVNTYVCVVGTAPASLACESKAIDGEGGLSLSLRYDVTDPDHFTETFEISGPQGSVQVRMAGRWSRLEGEG